MISIKLGILTLLGIHFLIRDITISDEIKTNEVASPIARPFSTVFVTARVGQRPITSL